MKYPVFYKNKYGKYRRIPEGLLEHYPDGTYGLDLMNWMIHQPLDPALESKFTYDSAYDRFILKDDSQ